MTTLRTELLTLPGAPIGPENPLPQFRDPRADMDVPADPSLSPAQRAHLGWQTGFRALPYRMQDTYTRARAPLQLRTVVLENRFLRATFAPELGGRLLSLVHLPSDRELLFRNPVFQPANLAIRNAWFAGGIEWNCGQYGHATSTCAPVFAATIAGPQGEPGLRLYDFERTKGLLWQLDCYLPPDSPVLIAHARVLNPTSAEASMYWWTNIAVPEAPDVRVLAPAREALYLAQLPAGPGFGAAELPRMPSMDGVDSTYALNSTFANEFFFQCENADMPWEAALDGQGTGLFEASTARLRYRKLFCWGSHQGGRRWQEFLALPGMAYLEIQAGLAPTQLHGLPMPAGTSWDWTQAFGLLRADPALAHRPDWAVAWQAVDQSVKELLPPEQLARIEQECRALADQPPGELLQAGSGWGALELERRARDPHATVISPAFDFPVGTIGPEQAPWLALLRDGALAEPQAGELPGAWMVRPEWRALLEDSLRDPAGQSWYAWLHAGVMRLEAFDEAGAAEAWRESIRLRPSAWAERNLAVLALRQGRDSHALAHYAAAWELATMDSTTASASEGEGPMTKDQDNASLFVLRASSFAGSSLATLAEEYLRVLCAAGEYRQALSVYEQLPAADQARDRVQILRGQIALGLGDFGTLEVVLGREYAIVREGETALTDLWAELWARRLAAATGRPLDEALRAEAARLHPPPAQIDFRMLGQ